MKPFLHGNSGDRTAGENSRRSALAEVIEDQPLRSMYQRLVVLLDGLHEDVRVDETSLELRAELGGSLLCRVVPYRELLHVQVGHSPTWEVRVRDQRGFEQAVDHVFRCLLRMVGGGPGPAALPGHPLR